ncbi:MAG: hypothetical protein QXW48_04670 [Thermoplasmata archaeon]
MEIPVEFSGYEPDLSTEAGLHLATTRYGTKPFPHTWYLPGTKLLALSFPCHHLVL